MGRRERLSVTSWPFRDYFDTPNNRERKSGAPRMDMKEFPAFVVEKFGVRNINPLGAHFSSTDDAYLMALREAVAKAGSHIVDLGLGGRYFYDADASSRQAGIDFGCKWIDIAVKLGSPSVRQHLELHPGQKAQIEPAAESLSRLAEYGAKRNSR